MTRSTKYTLLVLLVIVLLAAWWAWRAAAPNTEEVASPASAALAATSTTTYVDTYGNPAAPAEQLGTITVVHSWATWVPTSPRALRDLATVAAEYAEAGVVVYAINRSEPQRTVNQFLATYPVTGVTLLMDDADHFYTTSAARTMPETVFYNQAGDVVFRKEGDVSLEELRVRLQQALPATE